MSSVSVSGDWHSVEQAAASSQFEENVSSDNWLESTSIYSTKLRRHAD